ncbi:MAG: enoyl-CoA hydratase/isomerase family protein, partial [Actinobacteria bacterium]|nr:enoyl-CoA hydratase/isomerase family protein [Actinomycetota bacterium]
MTEPDRFHPTLFTTITVEIDEAAKVAVVTLDRPEAYNAFSPTMQEELKATWRAFRSDDRVNAIVLTAAGDTSFCVGIDRNEAEFTNMAGDSRLYGTSNNFMYDDPGDDLGPKSCDLWKPVICAVNGMACGGAFYMLAESDIIIAADHATFFDPHVTYGMAAVYEPMKMLQYMPLGEVLRMTLLGNHERMSAATAHRIGLVSEVCPADELMERARWVADAIASQPAVGVQASLRSIWAANDLGTKQALS